MMLSLPQTLFVVGYTKVNIGGGGESGLPIEAGRVWSHSCSGNYFSSEFSITPAFPQLLNHSPPFSNLQSLWLIILSLYPSHVKFCSLSEVLLLGMMGRSRITFGAKRSGTGKIRAIFRSHRPWRRWEGTRDAKHPTVNKTVPRNRELSNPKWQ